MIDLDLTLNALREEMPDQRLAAIEGPVLAGLRRRREAMDARRGMVLAGLVAIVVGFAGTVAPGRPAQAASLFGVPDAAPSHLLGD